MHLRHIKAYSFKLVALWCQLENLAWHAAPTFLLFQACCYS
uniref:Uncharacterized protein n=1 Tax=Arundo donax TaxID=35708 RepID=A0A0A8Y4V8_ARUDO